MTKPKPNQLMCGPVGLDILDTLIKREAEPGVRRSMRVTELAEAIGKPPKHVRRALHYLHGRHLVKFRTVQIDGARRKYNAKAFYVCAKGRKAWRLAILRGRVPGFPSHGRADYRICEADLDGGDE